MKYKNKIERNKAAFLRGGSRTFFRTDNVCQVRRTEDRHLDRRSISHSRGPQFFLVLRLDATLPITKSGTGYCPSSSLGPLP